VFIKSIRIPDVDVEVKELVKFGVAKVRMLQISKNKRKRKFVPSENCASIC